MTRFVLGITVLAVVVGWMPACSSEPDAPGVSGATTGGATGGAGSGSDSDAVGSGDATTPKDDGPNLVDLGPLDLPEIQVIDPDTGTDEGPPLTDFGGAAPGEFGAPCSENNDCDDGFCVPGPEGGFVCSKLCLEDCPPGWLCKGALQTEPDVLFICIWGQVELCKVCNDDTECGGKLDLCTEIGDYGDQYCTSQCGEDANCPAGYECTLPGPSADTGQCIPTTGSCVCTEEVDQSTRDCGVTNQFGSCDGEEICDGSAGWVGCSAAVPGPEICDAEDNDCDGSADEDFAPQPCSITNVFGTCTGVESCLGAGGLQCDALVPAAEACDGEDNDCDGHTDEEYLDSDGDTLANCVDPDDDDDTIADAGDNCPFSQNFSQTDADTDGLGDACDEDRDGDGVINAADLCPDDFDPDQNDADEDGTGDVCDDDLDGDGDPNETDCGPDDALISKSAVEACDGVDNDCDSLIDEGFVDTDQDLLSDCIDPDDDGDGDPDLTDCKPLLAAVFNGAEELCDGIDNDCDFGIDEGFPDLDGNGVLDCVEADTDGDGVNDGEDNCVSLANPGQLDSDLDLLGDTCDDDDDNDGDPDITDCAPLDAAVSTKVLEACDGADNNCDGEADEGFPDTDGDGEADCIDADDDNDQALDGVDTCPLTADPEQSDFDSDGAGDLCDDDDDNDAVPDTADNCPLTANGGQGDLDGDQQGDACDTDDDGDGAIDSLDCKPLNPAVSPGALEVCDGLDNNCNDVVDEGFEDTDSDELADCVDFDDDNDGDPDLSDCAPLDGGISNKTLESCDGVDNNCNGVADEGFTDTDNDDLPDCVDLDDDNDGDPDATDCAPTDPAVRHGAAEVCNGLDDNCEDGADEGFPDTDNDGAKDCLDADDDNDGDPDTSDCQPTDSTVSSLIDEVCDGDDDNCNGLIDEGFADLDQDSIADCVDLDDDGDADPDASDCNPKDGAVFEGATETCDGKDNDCDGAVDQGFADTDGDTFADCVDSDDDGDGDPDVTDCQPTDAAVSSLVSEICDDKDNDCDGAVDETFSDTDNDGTADCADADDDNDGVADGVDNCPLVSNALQDNADGDAQGDACDTDSDNDGVANASDSCPLDFNPQQLDTDLDSQGDACDTDDDGDGTLDEDDCKPLDSAIHPGAVEVCDLVDNDCDELVDEGFGDSDGDGQGDCVDTDDDNDGDPDTTDCKPLDPTISNFAPEACDAIDNDCDGATDEGFLDKDDDGIADCVDDDKDGDGVLDTADNCKSVANPDQGDADLDGFGNLCDADDDNDGDPDVSDCAPFNPAIGAGKQDACDGLDNDCDGAIDETYPDLDDDGKADCVDLDDDGDGDPDVTDCAPANAAISANADELCDGADNDCNGAVDEGFGDVDNDGTPDCLDLDDDNDGSPDASDCAPDDAAVHPGAAELCNGQDDDCNGAVDEGFPNADGDALPDCLDGDDDNDGDPDVTDCAPTDANISNLITEVCDGVDNDCDTGIDEGFVDTNSDGQADCVDDDDDGDTILDPADCAPKNAAISSFATEICDGVDNNCSGAVDEGFANSDNDPQADCVDDDDDNDGDPDVTDCADTDATVSSLVAEVCDNKDNDCDGTKDEGFPNTDGDALADCQDGDDDNDGTPDVDDNCPLAANDQTDTDGDSVGDACDSDDDADGVPDGSDNCPLVANAAQTDTDSDSLGDTCDPDDDGDGSLDADDCKPLDAGIFPGASEACDGIDNDCDAIVDEGFGDFDLDGIGDCIDTDDDNDGDPDTSDCQPVNPNVHASAVEVCDGIDQNCNGVLDDGFANNDGDGQADCVDADDDGDGLNDVLDNCPFAQNADQTDGDGDGVGDACDTDDDNDDVVDDLDNCPKQANASQTDSDADLVGNACDPDDDNDGHLDVADCQPLDATINPGVTEICDGVDNNCSTVVDEGFADFDSDGQADCIDPDDDGDNDPDGSDCAPFDAAAFNGAPELCDGVDNDCDSVVDEGHLDTDDDDVADCIDPDDDGDGVDDAADNCPLSFNPSQVDIDEDDIGDACDPVVPGPVAKIVIRDTAKGGGLEIADRTVELGQTLTLYAAGYDAADLFAGAQAVTWSVEGTLDAVVPAVDGKSATFSPTTPVTSGQIVATPSTGGVTLDKTGTITVDAPAPGPVDLAQTTIEPQRDSIVADGVDEVDVHVVLRDQFGTATTVGAPFTIVLTTDRGTMVGVVQNLGGGTYSQRLRASEIVETATLTATVDAAAVVQSGSVEFVQPELTVTGATTIDCANYNAFEGKSILVDGGTLTLNNDDTCPLFQFEKLFVSNGSITHDAGKRINVQVTEFFAAAGGIITATAKGPGVGNALPPGIQESWEVFGDIRNPKTTGRNNCPASPSSAGTPGGLVRIEVTGAGKFTLDGLIQANGLGNCAVGGRFAGASGGRIYIKAKELAGSGSIQAVGASFGDLPGNGGVVALVGVQTRDGSFGDDQIYEQISVRPGRDTSGDHSPSGIIYLEGTGAVYGDVILGSGAEFTTNGNQLDEVAIITAVPGGIITGISVNSITSAGAGWEPDRFVGLYVNPNLTQGAAFNLVDDTLLKVISNTSDTLILAGDPTAVAGLTDTFRGIFPMDNLELREKAVFRTSGDVLIRGGDRHSDDASTLEMTGGFDATLVDVGTVEIIRVHDTVPTAMAANLVYDGLWRAGNGAFPFDITLTLAARIKTTGDFSCADLTIDTGSVDADGNITITGDTSLNTATLRVPQGVWAAQAIAFQALTGTLLATSTTLEAPTIDLANGTGLQLTDGAVVTEQVLHLGDPTFPLVWTLDGTDVELRATLYAQEMSVVGASILTAGDISATATVDMSGGAVTLSMDEAWGTRTIAGDSFSFVGATLDAASITTVGDTLLAASAIVPSLIAGGKVTVDQGGFLTTQSITAGTDVVVQGTSTMTHPACTDTEVFVLNISASNLTIATGSNINLNRRGFQAGRTIGNTTQDAAVTGVGGSHGGVAGLGLDAGATVPPVYGNLFDPRDPGAGGGGLESFGGGALRANLSGTLTVNGRIMANGKFIDGGGGAGGSVSITATTVTGGGAGRIEVLGGDALDAVSGGGGGGRVALLDVVTLSGNFASASLTGNVLAKGGQGLNYGGAGTLFVRLTTDTYGTLYVDNGGTTAPAGSTLLPTFTGGTVTFLSGGTIGGAAPESTDRFVGYELNPNLDQGNGSTITGDTIVTITANAGTTLDTDAVDLSVVAGPGDIFGAVFRLDQLQVQGGAQLTTTGDILVLSGDASAGGTTFAVPAGASVTAQTLELVLVPLAGQSGTVTATNLVCPDCP